MIHSGDSVSRFPWIKTLLSLSFTSMLCFLKVTSMSPSHSTGTDSSAFVISLKAVAFVNCGGNPGILRAIVAVDVIVELLAH